MKSLAISREQHLERFRCTQSYYSLAGRELERETRSAHRRTRTSDCWCGVRWLADSSPESSRAAAATKRHAGPRSTFRPINKEKAFDIIDVLKSIADARGASVAQVALAWLLAQTGDDERDHRRAQDDQLEDNLKSVDITLTADELKALDDVSRLAPEYPAWMGAAASDDRLPGQERRSRPRGLWLQRRRKVVTERRRPTPPTGPVTAPTEPGTRRPRRWCPTRASASVRLMAASPASASSPAPRTRTTR